MSSFIRPKEMVGKHIYDVVFALETLFVHKRNFSRATQTAECVQPFVAYATKGCSRACARFLVKKIVPAGNFQHGMTAFHSVFRE
jgi:hypothetical protein